MVEHEDGLSRVFSALADPTRRDMVARLAVGDATVGALADPYDVSIQAVSKHVKVLTDAGLVTQSKDAQRRPCHLEAEVFDLMTKWIERYRRQAQERYERLDAVLAEMQDDGRTTTQTKDAQRRPCHLEAEVFDLMTKWIDRYRQQAQERYERLDAVLAEMRGDESANDNRHPRQGAAS